MGMSGDYTLAIQNGSTMVRVGSKIFGGRWVSIAGETKIFCFDLIPFLHQK
jgi:hypothetical protein